MKELKVRNIALNELDQVTGGIEVTRGRNMSDHLLVRNESIGEMDRVLRGGIRRGIVVSKKREPRHPLASIGGLGTERGRVLAATDGEEDRVI